MGLSLPSWMLVGLYVMENLFYQALRSTIMGISNKIRNMSDEEILREIGANDYREETKATLIEHIRTADAENTRAKDKYGHGVSVKGILVNVADKHFLHKIDEKVESGKEWNADDCVCPDNNVAPLETCNFFHVHTSGAATGSRAGFVYQVLDREDKIGGTISIAWENPWNHDFSNFVSFIKVDKLENHLQECLNYCADNSSSKIEGSVQLPMDNNRLKDFITVSVIEDDQTTAYLLVAIKTSDMEKAIWEGGL